MTRHTFIGMRPAHAGLAFLIGFIVCLAVLPNRGRADRVQLMGAACMPGLNTTAVYDVDGPTGFNNEDDIPLTLVCPVPSDDGEATDIGDAFDYLRNPAVTVHVNDNNSGASVTAYACYMAHGAGGACGSGDSSSSAGTSPDALNPATTVWSGLTDGTYYPHIAVVLPADVAGASSLIGYTVTSD